MFNPILVTVVLVSLPEIQVQNFDIPKFRGSVASQYRDFTLLHNHLEDRVVFQYPQVQFKRIRNNPTMVGILDGEKVLQQLFFQLNQIDINGTIYQIQERNIQHCTQPFGQTNELHTYEFTSPWMALNQENHRKYIQLPRPMRNQFLATILRGNLMSLSKGFDYMIPDIQSLQTYVDLKETRCNFKNNQMLCFTGSFTTNFFIPDYLGIGKQVARGFGTVRRSNVG